MNGTRRSSRTVEVEADGGEVALRRRSYRCRCCQECRRRRRRRDCSRFASCRCFYGEEHSLRGCGVCGVAGAVLYEYREAETNGRAVAKSTYCSNLLTVVQWRGRCTRENQQQSLTCLLACLAGGWLVAGRCRGVGPSRHCVPEERASLVCVTVLQHRVQPL